MAELIELEFDIIPGEILTLDKLARRSIQFAIHTTVGKGIGRIEKSTLVKEYTQNSKPAKPEGSTYRRTFSMQNTSFTRITSVSSFGKRPIEGQWEAKTKYASFVIGLSSQQAAIHSGRWPILELAIETANKNMSSDFDKAMKKVSK